jgi:hypothetical protein
LTASEIEIFDAHQKQNVFGVPVLPTRRMAFVPDAAIELCFAQAFWVRASTTAVHAFVLRFLLP